MVDVSGKDVTARSACATGRVRLSAEAVAALRAGEVPKGDALAVARIAGIAGAKRTPDLIPLCHPIGLHGVTVDLAVTDEGVDITAVTRTADRRGGNGGAHLGVSGRAGADRHGEGHRPGRGDYRRAGRVERRREDRAMAETMIKALAITVSNRAAAGVYADGSGPYWSSCWARRAARSTGRWMPDGDPVEAALRAAVAEG